MNSYNNIPELAQFNFPDVERPPILIFCPGLAMRKAGDFLQSMHGFPMGAAQVFAPQKCCGEFMSTKCLPKNWREWLGRKGLITFPEYGVYQNVYQGHFMPREMGFPGAFLRFWVRFLGVLGASYAPCALEKPVFSRRERDMTNQIQIKNRRNSL